MLIISVKFGEGKQYEFLVYLHKNVLLYSTIQSIIFFLYTFKILPPVRGGLKMLKMLKNSNFQNDGRKVIYSLNRLPRLVEECYIIFYCILGP